MLQWASCFENLLLMVKFFSRQFYSTKTIPLMLQVFGYFSSKFHTPFVLMTLNNLVLVKKKNVWLLCIWKKKILHSLICLKWQSPKIRHPFNIRRHWHDSPTPIITLVNEWFCIFLKQHFCIHSKTIENFRIYSNIFTQNNTISVYVVDTSILKLFVSSW